MMNLEFVLDRKSRRFFHFKTNACLALLGVMMTAMPETASAHPGHALHESSWGHLLLSPDHLLVLLALGTGLCLLGQWVQRRIARRALRWGGVAIVFVSLALFTLRF